MILAQFFFHQLFNAFLRNICAVYKNGLTFEVLRISHSDFYLLNISNRSRPAALECFQNHVIWSVNKPFHIFYRSYELGYVEILASYADLQKIISEMQMLMIDTPLANGCKFFSLCFVLLWIILICLIFLFLIYIS